jgi:hypothetical protein
MFSKLLKLANDNHLLIIGFVALIVLAVWFYGCESTVRSITDPTRKLTRPELHAEVDFLLAQAKSKLDDLDRKDAVKKLLLDQAALFSTTGTFNPMGALNTAISIIAVGSALDSRRKLKSARQKTTTTT